MVAINTLLTFAATLVPLVTGAALPTHEDFSLTRRQNQDKSWDDYHRQNGAFARQGLCLFYLDPSPRDGAWACGVYCKNDRTKICTTVHPSKFTNDMLGANPDGERYAIGKCQCDTSAADFLATATVDFTARGLDKGFREIGSVTCEIMVNVMKEAVFASTYAIPGVGPVATAARTVAKGVKLASKTQGGKDMWTDAVKESCNFRRDDELLNKGFGIFEGAPDEF
ncbi:uncharacterized protein FMAN_12261 [Fusarium mangiferae]|uniref:Uncharacterized protein n=1 Tax=Fusarium mangiferae TaxID=192010 RepID=A0A1L7TSH4_FUSMA|nr:uncharacterized protein FMAN_12261 [Fusarium mangiferae]CVK98201.1 uncharacterized protein FMAN_12261 [Fusarium mangiferae]